jgi:hypothetical protein
MQVVKNNIRLRNCILENFELQIPHKNVFFILDGSGYKLRFKKLKAGKVQDKKKLVKLKYFFQKS